MHLQALFLARYKCKKKKELEIRDYFRELQEKGTLLSTKLKIEDLRLADPFSFHQYLRINAYVYKKLDSHFFFYFFRIIFDLTLFTFTLLDKKFQLQLKVAKEDNTPEIVSVFVFVFR